MIHYYMHIQFVAVDQVQQRPVAQVLIDPNTSAVVKIPAADSHHRTGLNESTKISKNNYKLVKI